MLGDPLELKWNLKDLESLKHVVGEYVPLHRGDVAVQAGGCLGVFAKYLAKEFRRVYTFEPSPELFPLLVANVPEMNVVKLQAALGRDRGRWLGVHCEIRPNDGKTVLHAGMSRTEPGGIIPTIRLDDLGLDACDLIYLDIEGDELFGLQGAHDTIGKFRPTIACEINRGLTYRGFTRADVEAFLKLLDYEAVLNLRSDVVFQPRE